MSLAHTIKDVFIGAENRDWVGDAKKWIEEGESEANEVVSRSLVKQ